MRSRSVIGEREPREREQGNGDGVLPLESMMMSYFFREQGEWLERTEREQGKRDNRERTISDRRERTNSDRRERTQGN